MKIMILPTIDIDGAAIVNYDKNTNTMWVFADYEPNLYAWDRIYNSDTERDYLLASLASKRWLRNFDTPYTLKLEESLKQ